MATLDWKSSSIFALLQRQVKDYNSLYILRDICIEAQIAPAGPAANDVYYFMGSATATVFGIAGVLSGSFLVFNGTGWLNIPNQYFSNYKLKSPHPYLFSSTSITVTSDSFICSGVRFGRVDGTFTQTPVQTLTGLSGQYDYIIADVSGDGILSKGLKSYPWEEIDLPDTKVILAYKNAGEWASQFPCIQQFFNKISGGIITDTKQTIGKLMAFPEASIACDATSFTISGFRYGKLIGGYIEFPLTTIAGFVGAQDCVIADCRGESVIFSKAADWGSFTWWWQVLDLPQDVFVLAYMANWKWGSQFPAIQNLLETKKATPVNLPYLTPNGALPYLISPTSITITGLRMGRMDGTFGDLASTTIGCTGSYDYIIADCSAPGIAITITKGTKSYWWLELNLTLAQVVLCYKNSGIWESQFPQIQQFFNKVISSDNILPGIVTDTKQTIGKLMTFPGSFIACDALAFTISGFRYGRLAGGFTDIIPTTVAGFIDTHDCIIADCRGANMILSKKAAWGANFWWDALNLPQDVFVLAYINDGRWGSQFACINELIHEQNYHTDKVSFTTIEKTVKAVGSVGTDCDFIDIKSALDSITDSSINKRYTLRILDGIYDLSNDGNNFLGIRNYVSVIGQSRKGVEIIKRQATINAEYSLFDVVGYTGGVQYALFKNLTLRSFNCKAPIHADSGNTLYFMKDGIIEIENCDLINENVPGDNFENCLALGLHYSQKVICRNVFANGMLWMHNALELSDAGCSFELYNCMSKAITVGELISYNADKVIIRGCKADAFHFSYAKNYPTSSHGHFRTYRTPSFTFEMEGNQINYIDAIVTSDGDGTITETDAMKVLYGGKWSITDGSIHNYCRNESGSIIIKGTLVILSSNAATNGIEAWQPGKKLYGIAMEDFQTGGLDSGCFGIVQYSGIVSISADGTAPISFNDALELNSSGIAVKHTSGEIIGYAKMPMIVGVGIIRIKLII
jgi:hypothetical protein